MKFIASLLIAASCIASALDAPKFDRDATRQIIITVPAGAHARYTIDGSAPGAKSGPYLAPIFLDISAKLIEADGSISKDVMNDYLHPTAKGYEIIASGIEPTLKKLLGE